MGDELFSNVEQIIPTKEAEDFMIGLAEKAQDEVAGVSEQKADMRRLLLPDHKTHSLRCRKQYAAKWSSNTLSGGSHQSSKSFSLGACRACIYRLDLLEAM